MATDFDYSGITGVITYIITNLFDIVGKIVVYPFMQFAMLPDYVKYGVYLLLLILLYAFSYYLWKRRKDIYSVQT